MERLSIVLLTMLLSSFCFGQKFKVDTLQYQGKDENVINFVILADGYTKEEMKYFKEDAEHFKNYFFQTEPFSFYSNYFNIFTIETISKESGAIHEKNAADCPVSHELEIENLPYRYNKFKREAYVPASNPETIFGSKFDAIGIHRLLIAQNEQLIKDVLQSHIPNYTQVIILVNSPYYGGSGGMFPTTSVNFKSNDIAVHEIGHSFGRLADEYWAGNYYAKEEINFTQDPTNVPWKKWIGTNGVGVYPFGATGSVANWYRPHEYCKMQYLVAPFCNVCQEVLIETIHDKTSPIIKTTPDTKELVKADKVDKFSIKLAKPSPNTLKVDWFLNDVKIASNIDSVFINKGVLKNGLNYLKTEITDTTALVRTDDHHRHHYHTSWTIDNTNELVLDAPIPTWGNKIETCFNSNQSLSVKHPRVGVKYNWYSEEDPTKVLASSHVFITPKLNKTTRYFVESEWNGKKSEKVAVDVVVLSSFKPFNKVKISNKSNISTIQINEKAEKDVIYKWYDENFSPIYKKGANVDYDYNNMLESGNTIKVDKSKYKFIYVQKYNSETTCSGEMMKIKL